jgi:hypothetical protein
MVSDLQLVGKGNGKYVACLTISRFEVLFRVWRIGSHRVNNMWIIFENYGGLSSRITIQLVAKLVFER